jgi:hypothetical protein
LHSDWFQGGIYCDLYSGVRIERLKKKSIKGLVNNSSSLWGLEPGDSVLCARHVIINVDDFPEVSQLIANIFGEIMISKRSSMALIESQLLLNTQNVTKHDVENLNIFSSKFQRTLC